MAGLFFDPKIFGEQPFARVKISITDLTGGLLACGRVGMSGRRVIELVIASIALEAGLFDQSDPIVLNLFSALVILAVVTTLVTPPGIHRLLAVKPTSP